MLRKSILVFFAVLALVFLQSIIFIKTQTSQAQQSNPEVRPFTDLTLEISTTKDSLVPLKPIPIIIKQSNKTNQPVFGYDYMRFGYAPLNLYIQKLGDAERKRVVSLTPLRSYISQYKNIIIPAGDSREWKEWLAFELNQYFPEPGTYQLQMVLLNPGGTQSVKSNTIEIEIKEPIGVDREVYNLIKKYPRPDSLFTGMDFNETKDVLEAIATKFPNNAYAKNSTFLLGQSNFYRKQYTQALGRLMKLENDKDFIFAEKVKKYLKEIRELEKEKEEK